MPILHHKQSIHCGAELGHRRKHAARENILVKPWIGSGDRGIVRDGVEQEEAVRFQSAVGRFHQRSVILISDVLAQTDGSDLIEFAGRFPVIPLNHFNGKARTPSARKGDLLRGHIMGHH
jgi:hypothetical protein